MSNHYPSSFLSWVRDHETLNIAFTGHRPDKLGGYGSIRPVYLNDTLDLLDTIGIERIKWAYDGMAQGYDWEAVKACFQLGISLVACRPSERQHTIWPDRAQQLYRALLNQLKASGGKIVNVEQCILRPTVGESEYWSKKAGLIEVYHNAKSSRHQTAILCELRNQYMVDSADLVIACWDGSSGGTANCVKYAEKAGIPWINIMRVRS
ncbi:MAG: hypothetical protein WC359_14930 [Dehalococcoidia bacterium]